MHPGSWILFGIGAALNLVVVSAVTLVAVLGLSSLGEDGSSWVSALPHALAMLAIAAVLVVATSWHLIRLTQGRRSLVLGIALLLPAVVAWSLGNV